MEPLLRRLGAPAVLAAALTLGQAGSALASTVTVRATDPDVPQLRELIFTASAGEANVVDVSQTGTTFLVADTGAVLTAGLGCTRIDDHQAAAAR